MAVISGLVQVMLSVRKKRLITFVGARMNPVCAVQVGTLFFVLMAWSPAIAQEKKDNTGTNPVNFTYDARFYSEMASFDGGSVITNTYEFRWPFGGDVKTLRGENTSSPVLELNKKAAFRIKARQKSLSLENSSATPFGTSEVSGIGDLDARIIYMAYASQKLLVAAAFEAFFDIASNDALGYDTTVLAPALFLVFPGILGGHSLFVPGYQYLFGVGGDDSTVGVSRSQIDLYFVWLLGQGKFWLIVDPQVVLDHENKTEPALIEVEWGYMIAQAVGVSTYIRPGVGIGGDRPYDWNLEVGLKFVWR